MEQQRIGIKELKAILDKELALENILRLNCVSQIFIHSEKILM